MQQKAFKLLQLFSQQHCTMNCCKIQLFNILYFLYCSGVNDFNQMHVCVLERNFTFYFLNLYLYSLDHCHKIKKNSYGKCYMA